MKGIKVQTSSYKIKQQQEYNIHHKQYGQQYCNNCTGVARLLMVITTMPANVKSLTLYT